MRLPLRINLHCLAPHLASSIMVLVSPTGWYCWPTATLPPVAGDEMITYEQLRLMNTMILTAEQHHFGGCRHLARGIRPEAVSSSNSRALNATFSDSLEQRG